MGFKKSIYQHPSLGTIRIPLNSGDWAANKSGKVMRMKK